MYHRGMTSFAVSRVSLLLVCAGSALLACTSRTLDSDGDGASSSDEVSSAPATSSVSPTTGVTTVSPTTADPTTTSTTGVDPGTTTTTMGPTSADPSLPGTATATGDPSLPGTATDDPQPHFDLGHDTEATVPEGIWQACSKVAPPGTAIKGDSALGPFMSTRAFFGYIEINGQIYGLRLLFLDDSADSELAFQEASFGGPPVTGPAADVQPALKFTLLNPFWVGVDPGASVSVVAAGQTASVITTVEVTGHQGSWDVVDPSDPARLQGTLGPVPQQPLLIGDFDAVFCDLLSTHIIAE